MTAQNFDVNKLKVAKPCHVGWENMSGDESTRFCNACKLNVYNFSEMDSAEINSLVKTAGERVCGRLYRRSDGTVLTKDCPVGFRKYQKRVARYAGAAFATILGMFSVGLGQTDSNQTKDDACKIVAPAKIFRTETKKDLSLIGSVTDANGAVIPHATVTLINEETEEKETVTTNDDGKYEFLSLAPGEYRITFESIAFKKYEISNFMFNKNEELKMDVRLEIDQDQIMTVGIIVGHDPQYIDMTKTSIDTTITRDMFNKVPLDK